MGALCRAQKEAAFHFMLSISLAEVEWSSRRRALGDSGEPGYASCLPDMAPTTNGHTHCPHIRPLPNTKAPPIIKTNQLIHFKVHHPVFRASLEENPCPNNLAFGNSYSKQYPYPKESYHILIQRHINGLRVGHSTPKLQQCANKQEQKLSDWRVIILLWES